MKEYVYNVLYNGKIIDQIRIEDICKTGEIDIRDNAYAEALNNLEVKLED